MQAPSPSYQLPLNVKGSSASPGSLSWLEFLARNVLVPALLGAIAVVTILPINVGALVFWLALLAAGVWKQRGQRSPTVLAGAVLLQLVVMITIVTAAHWAPGKTTDRFLARTITLPKPRLTLGELADDTEGPRPEWRATSVCLTVADAERMQVIEFPATVLTLREFVAAVESQSELRHRFAHCGNGSTILWGGDCSFGLHLRRPPARP